MRKVNQRSWQHGDQKCQAHELLLDPQKKEGLRIVVTIRGTAGSMVLVCGSERKHTYRQIAEFECSTVTEGWIERTTERLQGVAASFHPELSEQEFVELMQTMAQHSGDFSGCVPQQTLANIARRFRLSLQEATKLELLFSHTMLKAQRIVKPRSSSASARS